MVQTGLMSSPVRLSTTSHAILGLLAYRPATAYELAKGMETNFAYLWPHARSHVFAETKKLAELGLAQATPDAVGRRARTVYSLTATGRGALEQWLATPPTSFALEIEGLVRLFLAPFGTRDDLLQALEAMRAEAEVMLHVAGSINEQYLQGTAPAQEQVHLRALLVDFLTRFAELTEAWAARSLATVAAWDDLRLEGKEAAALGTIAAAPRLDPTRAIETWGHRPRPR